MIGTWRIQTLYVAVVLVCNAAMVSAGVDSTFSYQSTVDGVDMEGRIWIPDALHSLDTPVPLVLFFGGGQGRANIPRSYKRECDKRGWIVASLSGRPWDMPGNPFKVSMAYVDSPNPQVGPGLQDILDGVDWLVERFPVDEDRIYLSGFSLGGRGAYMIGLQAPDRFAAIAPFAPATDMFEIDIRTPTSRGSYAGRMAIAGGVPGTSDVSATMRFVQSARFLIENAYNLPVFHGHGQQDGLARNLKGESGSYQHGYHMTVDNSWNGCYEYQGRQFCFGHTPTLSELHARHPDGYDFAYMTTPVKHTVDSKWITGTPVQEGIEGVLHPDKPGFLIGAFDFFARHTRIKNPDTVVYKSYTDSKHHHRAYWATIDISSPWTGRPGAVRAHRDLDNNLLDIELVRVAAASFDLEKAGLRVSPDTPLTVIIQPLMEPAYDPALMPRDDALKPVLIFYGDFVDKTQIRIMRDDQQIESSLVESDAGQLRLGPLPIERPTKLVISFAR